MIYLKWVCVLVAAVVMIGIINNVTGLADVEVGTKNAIIIDELTGNVLYEKASHERGYPASLTKMMTAILAIERGKTDDILTASEDAVNSISRDSSKLGLVPGEKLTLKDMLYGLMVKSGNDCANAIAEYISGSVPAFVEEMNLKAAEIGALDTHFVNTHGLHDENHYSTAYDLALISRYGMGIPFFRTLVETFEYTVPPTEKTPEERVIRSTNRLLDPNAREYMDNVIGIKTGFTDAANACLSSAAKVDDRTFLVVILGAENSFADTKTLYDYAFSSFSYKTVASSTRLQHEIPIANAKGQKYVTLYMEEDAKCLLPNDFDIETVTNKMETMQDVNAPIVKGDVLGEVSFFEGDKLLTSVNLVADKDYEYEPLSNIVNPVMDAIRNPWIYIFVLLILIVMAYVIFEQIARRRRRARREAKRRTRIDRKGF